ncbi:MAG: Bug family tripartite tricarboxylate transporter substrate binding protein [Beijerinckiaceae bacterium]
MLQLNGRKNLRGATFNRYRAGWTLASACVVALTSVSLAKGETPAEFYAGKRLTMIVAAPAGSGYDMGARILSRHYGRHIPGTPGVIVQNMPGGGGRTGTAYVYSAAPRNGTVIAAVQSFIAVDPLFAADNTKAHFDPRQFNWLGSIANSTSVTVVTREAKAKKWQDLYDNEVVVGGVGAATPMVTFPYLFSRLLGMKFKVVAGYLGGPDVDLAMERGEIQGRVDYSWHTLKATRADWIEQGKIVPMFQLGLAPHPDLKHIPMLLDLVKEEEQKRILEVVFMSYAFGRAFLTTPETPADRLAALRQAFEAAMTDEAFLAEAEAAKMEVNPVSAQRLQDLVANAYAQPPSLIARAAALQKPDAGGAQVQFKLVRALILGPEKGPRVSISVIDGGQESVAVDDGRTKVTINRKEAKRADLKAGMTCAIAYLGDKSTAKSVDCD